MERITQTVADAEAAGATEEEPVKVSLTLTSEIDPADQERYRNAVEKLDAELGVER